MKKRRHLIRLCVYAVITVLIMAFIFYMSSQNAAQSKSTSSGFLRSLIGSILGDWLPKLSEKGIENDIRKYAHMFEFACLALSAYLFFDELYLEKTRRIMKALLCSFTLCFLYACTDEWHQRFVPGRAGRFSDVLVDCVGILAALLLVTLQKILARRLTRGRK